MRRKWIVRLLIAAAALLGFGRLSRAVRDAREAARSAQCVCNLKMIGMGLFNYHESAGSFPPGTIPNAALPPEQRLSWYVAAWGWVGDGQLILNLDRSRGWNAPANRKPTVTSILDDPPHTSVVEPSSWQCPSRPEAKPRGGPAVGTIHKASGTFNSQPEAKPRGGPAVVHYVGVAGVGPDAPYLPVNHRRSGVFGYDRVTRLVDILGGASNAMMIIETAKDSGPWTAGGPATVRGVDPSTRPYIGAGRPFGGIHKGGVNVLFADGSIRFVPETIDRALFERRATLWSSYGARGDGPY